MVIKSMTEKEFKQRMKNVLYGVGVDLRNKLVQSCPVDSGRLKGSISWKPQGETIEISMVGYALYVEFGTPPHIIKPKTAKALHWKVDSIGPRGGKKETDVFAKVVKHPGTAPQPFIRATVRNHLRRIVMDNIRRHLLQ